MSAVVVEGKNSFFIGGAASLLDAENYEKAWAERTIKYHPALKWLVGRYAEADRPNSNKQYWSLDQLRMGQPSISHSPMNFLHNPRRVVGHWADTEMMYPKAEEADDGFLNPYIESLGAFYAFYFPQELELVERAHSEGNLFLSMECVGRSLICGGDFGCGKEYAYQGPKHESYCAHLNDGLSIKEIQDPLFLAGALLIPPVLPGWKNARVKELSELVKENAEEAEAAYEGIKDEFPHLSVAEWESLMALTLEMAKR